MNKNKIADQLKLYNTLSRKKEVFKPLKAPFVGLYVCGPTVYNDVHLGNCRTFVVFDILYRYLKYLGYQVKYVRNITDVGHLTDDSVEEDKILKKARIEKIEPMQVVQRYTNRFRKMMAQLNNLSPDIEPSATGHIIEQIAMIKDLLKNGFAYETNGSIYFDIKAYGKLHDYGELSGRVLADLLQGSRDDLKSQKEKKHPFDFALWKKASPNHIMRWDSPWGFGFPGWHIECSVMSAKYLGKVFDIHGGGMDLKFPHHECEIAQSKAYSTKAPVRYWIHTNMLTLNKKKMSKSDGNVILPQELFEGTNPLIKKKYSQMTLRFAMLQTHYRSTMDIGEEALQAAQRGYKKLMNGLLTLEKMDYPITQILKINTDLSQQIQTMLDNLHDSLNDDLNTAKCIANLFNLLKKINTFYTGKIDLLSISRELFETLKSNYRIFILEVLGLKLEENINFKPLLLGFIDLYKEAKKNKDYSKVDKIRSILKQESIILKDTIDKVEWAYDEQ